MSLVKKILDYKRPLLADLVPFLNNSKSRDYDEEIPIMDSKENTCSDCNFKYRVYAGYKRHLIQVHQMKDLLIPNPKSHSKP